MIKILSFYEKDYHTFHSTLHGITSIECPKQQGTKQSLKNLKSATKPFNVLLACTCPLLLN